jgi:hypothetical protein
MVIWEILGARKLALATKQQPNYGEYSKKAKCLAALVRYSDAFLVPLPNVSNDAVERPRRFRLKIARLGSEVFAARKPMRQKRLPRTYHFYALARTNVS